MARKSKRMKEVATKVTAEKTYTLPEAIELLKECSKVKFNESVDIAIKMGVDPKKSDQQVRGTVSLPNGTGKTQRVLVFTRGAKAQEALDAGADYAGDDELLQKVQGGWTDFDAVIASPDMMRDVGRLGKILGPRGLMPTPKAGTVTNDVAQAVKEIKGGKIEFKLDRHAIFNNLVGKLSFATDALVGNIQVLLKAILRAKPASAKGQYIQSVALSSTMGPGLKIDTKEIPST